MDLIISWNRCQALSSGLLLVAFSNKKNKETAKLPGACLLLVAFYNKKIKVQ